MSDAIDFLRATSHLPQCELTEEPDVLRCIFDYVDTDKNGLISLLEFMSFGVKELHLCSLNSEILRARFHAIDCDGSGGLDYDEFVEFLEDVCYQENVEEVVGEAEEYEGEEEEYEGEEEAEGQKAHHGSALSLESSLALYIKQQVKKHERCAKQTFWAKMEAFVDNPDGDEPCMTMVCTTQLPCDGIGQLERQEMALNYLSDSIDARARKVLEFWFPLSITHAMMLWFSKSPLFIDKEIRKFFGELVEQAANGELDSWTADPLECLALIILLDQFPRKIFRHQKRMYATDAKAQAICAKAMYHDYHRTLTPMQAIFMPCLVLTHSELFYHQELCFDIWCHLIQPTLPQDDRLRIFGMIFLNHLKVVAKFGRFPHRNEILDRECTMEEQIFLNDKSFKFDLPLHYSLVYEDEEDEGDLKVVFEETADFMANKERQTNEGKIKEHVFEVTKESRMQLSPEMKQFFLRKMQSWKKTLENKFQDSDKVIKEKCGKSAYVIDKAPETCRRNEECPELQFDTKSSVKANEQMPIQWTKSSGAERQTRKYLMAKMLSPAKK